jgi:ArsR family transcriptional regulator
MLLASGELCVCQIEAALGAHQAKISRHLAYLRKHKIVKVRSQWKWKHYSLAQPRTRLEESVFKYLKEQLQNEKPFKLTYGQMKKCLTKPLSEIVQMAKKL